MEGESGATVLKTFFTIEEISVYGVAPSGSERLGSGGVEVGREIRPTPNHFPIVEINALLD